jgi:hypothetical protein
MAGRTVHGRAFEDSVDMAICTYSSRMFAIEVEGKFRMIYLRGFPSIWCVTGTALGSELSGVSIILGVTGAAVLRCAFEDTVDMAFLACHRGMLTVKVEGKLGMIYFCQRPAFGRVTSGTVGSKLTVVMVIFCMTGETRLWSRLQISDTVSIDMALGTSQRRMFTDQIEWHFIMVKA